MIREFAWCKGCCAVLRSTPAALKFVAKCVAEAVQSETQQLRDQSVRQNTLVQTVRT